MALHKVKFATVLLLPCIIMEIRIHGTFLPRPRLAYSQEQAHPHPLDPSG
jgi:hypothetical protein